MTVKRSQRMAVVLMLAERHEQEAADYLTQHKERVDQQQAQYDELLQYRETYVERYQSEQGQLVPQDLVRYSQFIQHLAGAIDEQEQALELLNTQLAKLRQHWHGQHLRRKAIGDLLERLKRGEGQAAERQLQKQLDEMAQAASRAKL